MQCGPGCTSQGKTPPFGLAFPPPLAARSTAPPLSLTDRIVIPQGSHHPTSAIGTHHAPIQPRACDLCDRKPGWVAFAGLVSEIAALLVGVAFVPDQGRPYARDKYRHCSGTSGDQRDERHVRVGASTVDRKEGGCTPVFSKRFEGLFAVCSRWSAVPRPSRCRYPSLMS